MSRIIPFVAGFTLAIVLVLSSLALFAQDGTLLSSLRPVLIDVKQSIPVVADIAVPVDGEMVTTTMPFTLDVALRIGIRGQGAYTVASVASPTQVDLSALPANGEAINMEGIEWAIISAKNKGLVVEGNNRDSATDGKFIVIVLEVRNTTDDLVNYIVPNLVDAEGRIYEKSDNASYTLKENERCDSRAEINPGLKRECTIIYDVPTEADGLQLELSNLAPYSDLIETQLVALDIQ